MITSPFNHRRHHMAWLHANPPQATDQSGNRNNLLNIPESQPEARPQPTEPTYLPLIDGASSPHTMDAQLPIRQTNSDHTKENHGPSRSSSPSPPLVVVEKIDDKPSFGDDFGDEATNSQARELSIPISFYLREELGLTLGCRRKRTICGPRTQNETIS